LLIGFITGFFGIGGGFVIMPILMLGFSFSIREATGTALFVITVASASGLLSHLTDGGLKWDVAIPFGVAGSAGALIGQGLGKRLPVVILRKSFAGTLAVLACFIFLQNLLAPSPNQRQPLRTAARTSPTGSPDDCGGAPHPEQRCVPEKDR
jgi:uncharacterized membrane protein YfcA